MKKLFTLTTTSLLIGAAFIATATPSYADRRDRMCRAEARHAARHAGGNNVAAGALTGAAIGGLFGAITGHGHASNTLTGVAVGGVGGGLLGAAGSNEQANRVYWQVYNECMGDY